jgi:hypothetical protein
MKEERKKENRVQSSIKKKSKPIPNPTRQKKKRQDKKRQDKKRKVPYSSIGLKK